MDRSQISVIDCDGHLVESIPEMAEFMDPSIRAVALRPGRNRQGVFPSLDSYHYPSNEMGDDHSHQPIRASSHRAGSGEDLVAFLEKAEVEQTVVFPSEGLSVGNIRLPYYAVQVCRAYNDYVAEHYRKVDDRIHPMALIPMPDPASAVQELRRAVKDLDLPGAMLPSTGLPLHVGHELYWPVYEEAANLGCALAFHGGANSDIGGLDTFSNRLGARLLWHPMPLVTCLVSLMYHGVLDRFPDLHVGFMEGGAAWTVPIYDRMARDAEFYVTSQRTFVDYMTSGQILVGCEGNDESLAYIVSVMGEKAFAYASDYPHEVDLPAARKMVDDTLALDALTDTAKRAVLGENAREFFRLPVRSRVNA